jgi:hypothetical protein
MIVHDVEQGSKEWARLRMGIPTASNFHKIITPGGKPSKQAEAYRHHLLAEMLIGLPIDAPTTAWMDRGVEMEDEAVCFYEFERDVAVRKIGFVTDDAVTLGASPDRLIGEDGLLEIKCPSPAVHVGYLMAEGPDDDYRVQLQGQMLVTGRDWVDICAYHPAMPSVIVRVVRNEEFMEKLTEALSLFCAQLRADVDKLEGLGYSLKGKR